MGAENHFMLEFPEIDRTAGFLLPRPLSYEFYARNPIGAENQVFVEFAEMDSTVGFWLPGRGDTNSKQASPTGPKITF